MARDPVHLCVGVYDGLADAELDFESLKRLHAEGVIRHFDAAVLTRGPDGTPHIEHKKHAGHPILFGGGVGVLVSVLAPLTAIPFALLGAGAGALVGHGRPHVTKAEEQELAEALATGGAAIVVAGDAELEQRIAQAFPLAVRRVAHTLDGDDFAEALDRAKASD